MKKYMVIDEYSVKGKSDLVITQTKIVDAEAPGQAAVVDLGDVEFDDNPSDLNLKVRSGDLEVATVGIYELTTGHNELEDIVAGDK